ncbi:MAG: DUF1439 domain-containing protein [Pseudomonadota bacterium]
MIRTLLGLLITGALGWCAYLYLSGGDVTLRIGEPQLRAMLDAGAPYRQSYYDIFDVEIDEPRVDLSSATGERILGGADVKLTVKVGGFTLPLNGAVDLSGGIAYQPDEGAFFLTNPQIIDLRIPGVPARYSERARSVVSLALGEFYRHQPVYVLEERVTPHRAAKLLLRDVKIADEKLVVTLGRAE